MKKDCFPLRRVYDDNRTATHLAAGPSRGRNTNTRSQTFPIIIKAKLIQLEIGLFDKEANGFADIRALPPPKAIAIAILGRGGRAITFCSSDWLDEEKTSHPMPCFSAPSDFCKSRNDSVGKSQDPRDQGRFIFSSRSRTGSSEMVQAQTK
jgi:hypothetical protein